MNKKVLRFWFLLTWDALRGVCRKIWIPVGLSMLCLLMTLGAGAAAGQVLSRGVSLSRLNLAIQQEPGENLPALLETYMGRMEDISRYCTVAAMSRQEAEQALADGSIDALVILPEGFVEGVMDGENPDVEMIVSGREPLEALLTLWTGQSAADLLSAVQSGIYAVLDVWQSGARGDMSWEDVLLGINLRYVGKTLNRQKLFGEKALSPTGVLPMEIHYGLSLLAFLGMSFAPFYVPLFGKNRLRSRKRLRALGYRNGFLFGAELLGAAGAAFLIFLVPAAVICRSLTAGILGAGAMAVFCSLFGCLCCLLTDSAAACSVLSFLTALTGLILAGGIVPPVLLPETLRSLGGLSPVTWLRTAGAWAICPGKGRDLALGAAVCLLMALGAGFLYSRRLREGGGGQ